MRSFLLSLAIAVTPAFAAQGSNFNVSPEIADSYGCDELCFGILQHSNQVDLDFLGHDFDFDFYNVAAEFNNDSKPGDLLKLKPIDPTTLTTISGVSVYRMQYVSQDEHGLPVPVTGAIILPFALPDSGVFPLVAWAHGTIGAYAGCAVSNSPDIWDYDSWTLLSERGYALVATDYAGLGTNYTTHKYANFPLHAMDVFNSVIAARKAFGKYLSKEWMAVGHSQGGGAVWKLAEDIEKLDAKSKQKKEAQGFLASVALAPATRIIDMAMLAASKLDGSDDFHDSSAFSLAPLLSLALKRFDSRYTHSILGDLMKARMDLADLAQSCVSAMFGLTMDLDFEDVADLNKLSAADASIAYKFQDKTAPSNAKAQRPVLVVQGINDTAILVETTEASYTHACKMGSEMHMLLYPKQDHSGLLAASAVDWTKWIDERFSGVPTYGSCISVTKKAFDYKNVRAAPEVDPIEGVPVDALLLF